MVPTGMNLVISSCLCGGKSENQGVVGGATSKMRYGKRSVARPGLKRSLRFACGRRVLLPGGQSWREIGEAR